MKNVTIYSTQTCGYCTMAKEFFNKHNIKYVEKDVGADEEARHEMLHKSNQMGVPVIDIDGEIMVGFNEPKLAELLGVTV